MKKEWESCWRPRSLEKLRALKEEEEERRTTDNMHKRALKIIVEIETLAAGRQLIIKETETCKWVFNVGKLPYKRATTLKKGTLARIWISGAEHEKKRQQENDQWKRQGCLFRGALKRSQQCYLHAMEKQKLTEYHHNSCQVSKASTINVAAERSTKSFENNKINNPIDEERFPSMREKDTHFKFIDFLRTRHKNVDHINKLLQIGTQISKIYEVVADKKIIIPK